MAQAVSTIILWANRLEHSLQLQTFQWFELSHSLRLKPQFLILTCKLLHFCMVVAFQWEAWKASRRIMGSSHLLLLEAFWHFSGTCHRISSTPTALPSSLSSPATGQGRGSILMITYE
ncbi:hypothetical protein CapIbe_017727 [Capra ibex]